MLDDSTSPRPNFSDNAGSSVQGVEVMFMPETEDHMLS